LIPTRNHTAIYLVLGALSTVLSGYALVVLVDVRLVRGTDASWHTQVGQWITREQRITAVTVVRTAIETRFENATTSTSRRLLSTANTGDEFTIALAAAVTDRTEANAYTGLANRAIRTCSTVFSSYAFIILVDERLFRRTDAPWLTEITDGVTWSSLFTTVRVVWTTIETWFQNTTTSANRNAFSDWCTRFS